MKSWGKIATDSSQIEKAQSICRFYFSVSSLRDLSGSVYLGRDVFHGKQNAQYGASCDQVLHLESIEVGIMGGFVVVEHQIDDIGRCSNEDELEGRVPQAVERVGPQKI